VDSLKQIPDFITFTGLDERTDVDRVRALSDVYPIEWGVLFSPSRQGREPRYPAPELVRLIQSELYDIRLSAHLCGLYAAKINEGRDPELDLRSFSRVQINTNSAVIDNIVDFAERHFLEPIVQHRTLRFPDDDRVAWLYDCSGGRGEVATKLPQHPGENRLVGFAGGIRKENIAAFNDMVEVNGPYWLDLESGCRTNDWLDLDLVEAMCRTIFRN